MSIIIEPNTIPDTSPATRISAEEFGLRHPNQHVELINGYVQELPMPKARHGQLCALLIFELMLYLRQHDVAHVISHDAFFRIKREPDTVYGPDIALLSYRQIPKGPLHDQILDVLPELVIEVKSPSDRWSSVQAKVMDYLLAGVQVVVVVDDESQRVVAYRENTVPQMWSREESFTLPELLPGFSFPLLTLFP